MSVKWETKIDKLPKVIASTETIGGRGVEVGANWANAWL